MRASARGARWCVLALSPRYYIRGIAIVTVGANMRLVLIFLISSLSRTYINFLYTVL